MIFQMCAEEIEHDEIFRPWIVRGLQLRLQVFNLNADRFLPNRHQIASSLSLNGLEDFALILIFASAHIPSLNKSLHHHRGDEPRQRRREYEAAYDDDWYPEKCVLRQRWRHQDGE